MTTYVKDPDAILDYSVDWSAWLGTDTIATSTWTLTTGISQPVGKPATNTTTTTTVWLSGGKVGETYVVRNEIVTAAGRTDDRSFTVQVTDR